jgi:hypothetical protein
LCRKVGEEILVGKGRRFGGDGDYVLLELTSRINELAESNTKILCATSLLLQEHRLGS